MGISPTAEMMRLNVTSGASHENSTTEVLPERDTLVAESVNSLPSILKGMVSAPLFQRFELPTKHVHEHREVEAKLTA
jgi:hypothetical protein